jgi:DNA-binding beta-propeller fold protein YncE
MGSRSKRLKKGEKGSRKMKKQAGGQAAPTVITFAGGGANGTTSGFVDTAPGILPTFNQPYGGVFDSAGNMYVADTFNNKIRKITSAGIVTTFAGSGVATVAGTAYTAGDGNGTAATFSIPTDIAIDPTGKILYVADSSNDKIRKIIIETGAVSTIAGGGATGIASGTGVMAAAGTAGSAATFNNPNGITIDYTGNILYVADTGNNKIQKIVIGGTPTAPTYTVFTLAGSGTATSVVSPVVPTAGDGAATTATFNKPMDILIDPTNTFLYVADSLNNKIRKVIIATGAVSTIAGGGAGVFYNPTGLAFDYNGSIYVADTMNDRIQKINIDTTTSPISYSVSTFMGGTVFSKPRRILINSAGEMYVFESDAHRIRKVTGGLPVPTNTVAIPAPISGASTSYSLTGPAATLNVIDPITFSKRGQVAGWDTPLDSVLSVVGTKSCYLTFKPGQTTTSFIIGLNDVEASSVTDLTHSLNIDYGFHMYSNGTFDIREAGRGNNNIVTSSPTAYNTGDIFGIIYDTINYTYIQNGNSIQVTPVKGTDGLKAAPINLYLDGSMYDPGTLIQNVYFGILNDCPATS